MSRPTTMKVDGTVYWAIFTYTDAGVLVDADSTPTVAVRKNGASTGDAVTVTKRAATTGIYDCSHAPAGEVLGDTLSYEETATISAQAYLNRWSLEVTSNEVDVVSISGDTVAADNLELQYDGTGLDGDTFPAYQAQVSNIALTGSAVNVAYTSYTLTTGTTAAGSETDTISRDGVVWEIADVGGTIDLIGDFQIDSDGIPTGVTLVGKLDDKNEQISVQAYDWVTAGWVTVGQLDHVGGGSLPENNFALFTNMVGEGANSGEVRIRFFANGNLTGGDLLIDQLYVSYAVINRSVGYSGGAVWSDDMSGNTGVIPFIDGTADKRTGSYANAISVAASVGLTIYEWSKDDVVTLTQDHDGDTFKGFKYLLNMNNNKAPIVTNGAIAFGIDASAETHIFKECALGDQQNGNGSLIVEDDVIAQNCVVEDLELPPVPASAVNIQLSECVGLETGTFAGLGYIDFGNSAGTNHRVVASEWGGTITIKNMRTGDLLAISGTGTLILDASCTGGTAIPAGIINVIDNSATVNVVREGIITKSEVADAIWDEPAIGHQVAGTFGSALNYVASTTFEDALVDSIWSEDQSTYTTAGTFGYNLDAQVSAAGGGGTAPTEAEMYTYFTSASREDAFKADLSLIALESSVQSAASVTADNNTRIQLLQTTAALEATVQTSAGVTADNNTRIQLLQATAALESTSQSILADTDELQTNQGQWLTATTTVSSNMRGTDSALLASAAPTRWSDLIVGSGVDLGKVTTSNPASGGGSAHTAQDVANLILAVPTTPLGNTVTGSLSLVDTTTNLTNGGSGDWNATEKGQIRYRLGVDGASAVPSASSAIVSGVWDYSDAQGIGDKSAQLGSVQDLTLNIENVTDRIDGMLQLNGESSSYQYTVDALENAPSGGGGGPTVQQIVDGVWDESSSAHVTAGTFGAYVDSTLSQIRTVVDNNNTEILLGFSDIATNGVILTAAQQNVLASQASIDALNDFDPASDVVAHVTLVDTTTDLTNGGGGGSCPTAQEIVDAWGNQDQSVYVTQGTLGYYLDAQVSSAGSGGTGLYQATVRVQDNSNNALQGARVNVDGTTLTLTTGSSGEVTFNLDSGVYLLEVSPPAGYDTPTGQVLTISASDPSQTTFTLASTSGPSGCTPPWIG